MQQPLKVVPTRIYQKEVIVRDPLYRRFVRRLPCIACSKTWRVEACHTGAHAFGKKSSDLSVVPLCYKCHPQFDASPAEFVERHQLDIGGWIELLNHLWSLKQ